MVNKNVKAKRRAYELVMRGLSGLCALLTSALVLFLIAYVLIRGIPNISWEFLSTKPSYLADSVGILPDILNTLYIVLGTLVWVLPLGVGAAIYLTEYASNHRIVGAIEYAAETLSGIPSIIYGLGRHAVFLQLPRLPDIFAGRRHDACHHEPADRYAHDSGKPQNRSAEPARGRVRPRSRQVARYPHRRFPRLRGRHNYRLHPRPSAAFWANRQRCCSPRALRTISITFSLTACPARAPRSPLRCMSTPRSRATLK